jgi:hypothetical protein
MNYRALPGIFVAGAWLGSLPGVIFLPMALVYLWQGRSEAPKRFLLAWIFAYLLALEALSGKPPLYSLQSIMPAIVVAVAMMLATASVTMPAKTWARRLNGGLALLHDALPGLALIALLWLMAPPVLSAPAALGIISLAAVALAVAAALSARPFASLGLSIVGALAVYWGALQLALPAFERIWLSQSMASVSQALEPCLPGPVGIAGYSEPSAVFLLGTSTYSAKGPQGGALIARWLDEAGGRLAFVSTRAEAAFRSALEPSQLQDLKPIGCVRGLNFGRFQWLTLNLYTSADAETLAACPLPEFARFTASQDNPPR